jgi:hypothetical protein
LVEQRIRNAKVASSTPASGTSDTKQKAQLTRLGFLLFDDHVVAMQARSGNTRRCVVGVGAGRAENIDRGAAPACALCKLAGRSNASANGSCCGTGEIAKSQISISVSVNVLVALVKKKRESRRTARRSFR